jgi:hypothetical protein
MNHIFFFFFFFLPFSYHHHLSFLYNVHNNNFLIQQPFLFLPLPLSYFLPTCYIRLLLYTKSTIIIKIITKHNNTIIITKQLYKKKKKKKITNPSFFFFHHQTIFILSHTSLMNLSVVILPGFT